MRLPSGNHSADEHAGDERPSQAHAPFALCLSAPASNRYARRDVALRALNKVEIFAQLRQQLEADLQTATAAQQATMQGATHEEAKPENDKDTRALESSYLARGQAARVAELSEALAALKTLEPRAFTEHSPLALGALVALEDERERRTCYVLLPAGGLRLDTPEGTVLSITSSSPMGRALLGKHEGDDVEISVPGGLREYTISEVA